MAAVLQGLGYQVSTGIGGTGLVGSLTHGTSTRVVGLRAELDALPITERSGLDYASRNDGTMHACGHDGHMAMVLGAAAALAGEDFDGTVRVLFQPAEEPGRGARAMIDDGLFDRFPVDRLFGLHNHPGTAAGRLLTRAGPVMAGEDNFEIAVTGRGGHASAPHLVIDPLVVAAEIVAGPADRRRPQRRPGRHRRTVLHRPVGPTAPATRSPAEVVITGDTRSFTRPSRRCSRADPPHQRRVAPPTAAPRRSRTPTSSHRPSTTPTASRSPAGPPRRCSAPTTSTPTRPPIMASEDFGLFGRAGPRVLGPARQRRHR